MACVVNHELKSPPPCLRIGGAHVEWSSNRYNACETGVRAFLPPSPPPVTPPPPSNRGLKIRAALDKVDPSQVAERARKAAFSFGGALSDSQLPECNGLDYPALREARQVVAATTGEEKTMVAFLCGRLSESTVRSVRLASACAKCVTVVDIP